jgi:DHA2 family multidrug resistance protein
MLVIVRVVSNMNSSIGSGYRPLQAHLISLEIAATQLLLLPLVAVLLNLEWLDSRIISFVGVACIFTACVGDSHLDVTWNRDQFYLWQGLQSLGDAMIVLPLLMTSTNSVKEGEGPFASALVNTPRGLSEAIGAWIVQLASRWRGGLHSNRIMDAIGLGRFQVPHGALTSLVYSSPLQSDGRQRTYGNQLQFAQAIHQQVTVLTLSDTFLVMAGLVVALALVLLIVPVRTYPPRIALAKN